jgi:hypothetical protein
MPGCLGDYILYGGTIYAACQYGTCIIFILTNNFLYAEICSLSHFLQGNEHLKIVDNCHLPHHSEFSNDSPLVQIGITMQLKMCNE